jgi:hypothetical protein
MLRLTFSAKYGVGSGSMVGVRNMVFMFTAALAAEPEAPQAPASAADNAAAAVAGPGAILATPFAAATGPPESAPQLPPGFGIQAQQQQQQQQQPQQQLQQQQNSAPVPQSSPFAALAHAPQPQLTASSSLEQLLAGKHSRDDVSTPI